ncbi:MAG: peptidoglycan-associated lipoprotein Pal [Dongiaceae bacterium]
MKFKLLTLAAALVLAAACSSEPETEPVVTSDAGATTTAPDIASVQSYAPGSTEEFVAEVGDRVFFGYDRYDLTPEAQSVLQRQVAWLNSYPQHRVVIEGHCDERGTREYNLALGERRANAQANYMVALGLDPNRIVQVISYGKERPAVLGSDETAYAQNRRAVTVLSQ